MVFVKIPHLFHLQLPRCSSSQLILSEGLLTSISSKGLPQTWGWIPTNDQRHTNWTSICAQAGCIHIFSAHIGNTWWCQPLKELRVSIVKTDIWHKWQPKNIQTWWWRCLLPRAGWCRAPWDRPRSPSPASPPSSRTSTCASSAALSRLGGHLSRSDQMRFEWDCAWRESFTWVSAKKSVER